ncbi:MAG: peroxiredoxin [Leptolyngbyaceae cyanobacterium MO_188.B28]|nr:peroxiredoxin [Leptolyngbyaceae cyanobacterium MO_188.B28]
MSNSSPVKVGDRAPAFTLPNQSGATVNLADWLGNKPIVLFFYPKDDTPGCTAEACAFRDSYEVFQEAGAEVIGVSADTPTSHQQFANRHQLPYTLLSDQGNQVRKLYGVPATLFVLPGRVTYIIDRQGVVQHIFDSQLEFQAHVQEALNALKQIQTT